MRSGVSAVRWGRVSWKGEGEMSDGRADEKATGSGHALGRGWPGLLKAPGVAAFAIALAGLFLGAGCETDDEEESAAAPGQCIADERLQ